MINCQKIGGIAALFEAAIYISAFVFFGLFWTFPVEGNEIQKLAFLGQHQTILTLVNLTIYVIFGLFLVILVLALYQRLKSKAFALAQIASVFGLLWVGLVIASGMIANIGLATVIGLSDKDPQQAMTVWIVVRTIVEALGGGNEIIGGLWVLLLSVAALKSNAFSKKLNYFGLFVGFVGILTLYPAEILTEIFGLSQIIWFSWLGIRMLCENETS